MSAEGWLFGVFADVKAAPTDANWYPVELSCTHDRGLQLFSNGSCEKSENAPHSSNINTIVNITPGCSGCFSLFFQLNFFD